MNTERERYTPTMAVDLLVTSDVQVSNDGKQVAFCLAPVGHAETNPTSTILIAPLDGSTEAVPLTGREHNNVSPRWSPDGQSIAFLSDRQKRGEAQLYVVPAQGGEPLRLTAFKGGVAAPAWLPDGSGLTVTVSTKAFNGQAESNSEIKVASKQPNPRCVVRVPVLGGAAEEIGSSTGHTWGYALSPDAQRIATMSSPNDSLSDTWNSVTLHITNIGGTAPEHEIGPFSGPVERLVWSADGRHLAFIASRVPDEIHGRIWVVDTTSGNLTALDERGTTQNWIAFDGNSLVVLSVEGQRTRLDITDVSSTSWEQVPLPEQVANHWLRSVSFGTDGESIAVVAEPDTAPADVWSFRHGEAAVRLTDANPQLDAVELTHLEALNWTSSDGTAIEGWLMRPPHATEGERLPLVVYVHGGPSFQWGNWFHGTWHDWAHNLAARGFAVLLPNPRGSTGRGSEFTGANQADLGGGDFDDIMAGVDHLIERGIADENRLGIGGWSYGGFITAWAIGKTNRFKAAVAGAAVTNWVSKVGTTDIRRMNEANFPAELHEDPDALWERSPVRYLNDIKTPTLIVHGEADPRVPVTQGMELYLGLKAVGVDTEFVTYPRQKHAFHERAFQLDLLERVCDWYERYLLA